MKELQKTVEQLRDITNHYATLINSGMPFVVAHNDKKQIGTLLDKLIMQVKPYSNNLSTNLTDVMNNLLPFIVGYICGGAAGVFFMCLFQINRNERKDDEQ